MDPNSFNASGAGGFDDMDALLNDANNGFDPNFFIRKQSPSSTSAAGSQHGSSFFSATSPSNAGTSEASWHHSPQSSPDDLKAANDWNEWRDWVDFDWGQNGKVPDGSATGHAAPSTATFDFAGPGLDGPFSDAPLFQMMASAGGGNNFQMPTANLLSPFTMEGLDTANLAVPYLGTSQLPSIAEDSAADHAIGVNANMQRLSDIQSSIESPDIKASRSVSPTSSAPAPTKKRKLSLDDSDESRESPKPPSRKGTQESQRHHSNIEKRYRNKLNDMIAALRDAVPSLQQPGSDSKDEDDKGASSVTKGRVLSRATEYIVELETRNKKLLEEKALLQKQVMALGKLNGQLITEQGGTPRRSPGASPMSKVMVGGMAGMLAMQGFGTPEGDSGMPNGRGLFAVPVHLFGGIGKGLRHLGLGDSASVTTALHAFRGVLLLGAVLYIFLPSLFDAAAKGEKPHGKTAQAAVAETETDGQQRASPKDLRRDAFLTATQGVWVPRPFLQVALAVVLQATKLALLSFGVDPAAFMRLLPSRAQDDSTKAWDIALDAQLSGGDDDVTPGRLLVTLLGAASLPETPYRLMLRALHSEVLLASSAGLTKLALEPFLSGYSKRTWERARSLLPKTPKDAAGEESPLAPHLAALLELDAGDVLVEEVVDRACRLIYGTQSPTGADPAAPWLDSVADDAAVLSPLDFLASWRSGLLLRDVLVGYPELHASDSTDDTAAEDDAEGALQASLELAARVAPPRSAVWSRAYVMRALLVEQNQRANIGLAFKALLVSGAQSMAFSSYILPADGAAPDSLAEGGARLPAVAPDLAMALTCAIAMSRLRTEDEGKALKTIGARVRGVQGSEAAGEQLGLLGYVALYAVLDVVFRDRAVASGHKDLCEQVAGMLRVWARTQQAQEQVQGGGTEEGSATGLGQLGEKSVVGLCVGVLEWLVGIEGDGGAKP